MRKSEFQLQHTMKRSEFQQQHIMKKRPLLTVGVVVAVVLGLCYYLSATFALPKLRYMLTIDESGEQKLVLGVVVSPRIHTPTLPSPPALNGHTVTVPFKGRLGNVLFMYASLLGIAAANDLRPVISEKCELLNYFQLSADKVSNLGSNRTRYQEKSGLSYEHDVMKLGNTKDFLVDGYFQSWRYFKNIERKIRQEFTFKPEIRDNAQRQIDDVTRGKCSAPSGGCVYIGVHVRRGDFVTNKVFLDYGYVAADKQYLDQALEHFRKKFPKRAHFVVVSDEPTWCKENLSGSDVSVVTSRNPPHLDLAIVASLNHTVMTVGSYGWWGAWLAGGDIVYYKGYPRPGTTLYKLMNQTDYRYPGSIAL